MPFTEEDKILIKHYRMDKKYGRIKLLKEFPHKGWTLGGLGTLLKTIDKTGSIRRKAGSGRPKTARNENNINEVSERILSQEGQPGSHETPAQISKSLGISKSSIKRIIKKDLNLRPYKKIRGQKLTISDEVKRVMCAKKLLRLVDANKLNVCFFSDEKIFTVEPPLNAQNERVYFEASKRKNQITSERLFSMKSHFPKNVMISIAVSKLGKTSIHFVNPGVKINGEYYRNSLLAKMIPEMKTLASGQYFLFQQDGARAHTAKDTVAYLNEQVPEIILPRDWPANSPDLNPLDFSIWGNLSQRVYRGRKIKDVTELKNVLIQEWSNLPQNEIDLAIEQFRPRLRKVIEMEGKHIEQFF